MKLKRFSENTLHFWRIECFGSGEVLGSATSNILMR